MKFTSATGSRAGIRVAQKPHLWCLWSNMRNIAPYFIFVLLTLSVAAQQQTSAVQTNSPVVYFGEKWMLHSKILNEDRQYWIYLPPSYKPNRNHAIQKYPVLYLLDGESQFQWASQVVQFMGDSLQIPELIVVAIPNTDRNRDLTPTHDRGVASSGGGELFERFLNEELASEINAKFRTAPYRILAGHSIGGALVADAFLRQTNGFQAYIAIDPALWWDNEILIQHAKEFFPKTNSRDAIFIATADHPHTLAEPTNSIRSASELFISTLKTNLSSGIRIGYQYFEQEDHGSSRLMGLHDGLRFIFEDYKPTDVYALDEPSLIEKHFKKCSDRLGFEMFPPEEYVNNIGSALLAAHETDKAIECFKFNVTNYPNAANAYARLGDAYSAKGEKNLAIQNYTKALELNPNFKSVKKALEK